jgi:hypothetical protein
MLAIGGGGGTLAMFTIQYRMNGQEHTQILDSTSRTKLAIYLAKFPHTIVAVYEQATPITKAMQKELAAWPGNLSNAARDFRAI